MMILIIGFTCPLTIHFEFITKCDKCYYKVRLFLLLSATILLQSATEHQPPPPPRRQDTLGLLLGKQHIQTKEVY